MQRRISPVVIIFEVRGLRGVPVYATLTALDRSRADPQFYGIETSAAIWIEQMKSTNQGMEVAIVENVPEFELKIVESKDPTQEPESRAGTEHLPGEKK